MASIHDKFTRAIKQIIENDQRARAGLPYNTGNSISDKFERAIQEIRERDNASRQNTSSQPALTPSRTPSSTPASPLPSFATGSGNTVESVLGRFSGRGGVEAIKSPDSWSSAGDAELGLKAWSGQLESYEKKLTELSGSIANAENRLKNLQTTVKTAEDAAAYDELYAGYERMIADYNGVVNDINRVQDKYSAGVERYRDILSGGMERADAAAAEAKRLEDENSRLQQQANLIRIYEMSGTSSSSAAAPIEAQIEQNAERIKKLRAEENQNKMQYYSSLALMEDYAGLSSPASVTGDSRYEYINDIDNARYRNEHTTDPSGAPVALRRYQYLTEDEIKIYNYLYASQGKDAADRFLEDMGPALTERQGAAQYEELGALGKALYWIPAGLDQFGSGIRQLFQREAVPVSSTQITSQLIQQEAQEKSPVLGTLYTLGTTLSNMAPSILASALGSWALGAAGLSAGTASAIGRAAGGTALGASAGGNAYTQKLNEGYSSEAAQNYATLVGASEGALQYLLGGIGALSKSGTGRIAAKIAGLDNALGRVARTVSGSTAARLLGSMISEGTEEGLQELLEPAFAAIIFDDEYEADFEDAAYAFLLGALSAGIIEGPAAIAYARRPAGFSFRDMDGYADNGVDYFEGANTLEEVEARYRDLARQYHPDVGGDAATMAEINRQRTMARAFFRGRAEAAAADEAADTTPEAATNTERADSVIRRLTAGRTTEENTPETVRAPIEDQAYAEAGGIVLPTADTAGDFSPRAEAGATETPTLEAPRAAAPETNAAGNIVLPTADEIMNGGIQNGQQGQQWQQWGDQVSDGDGGRLDGISTGGQAGRLGGSAEVRSAPAEQGRAAIERQNRARDLRLQEVSSAELGIPEGTDTRNVRVLPETDWDDELVSTAERVRSVTGREVRYVLGSIEVRTAGGGTHRVRGVWMPNGDIIVQADNMRVSAQQIAEHEIYHDIAAQMPGTDYEVEERIREQFGAEEFERVVEIYIQKLHGIVDLPANASEGEFETALARIKQEIFADAYAGINAFGAHAERFADPTRETVKERTGIRSRENDDATRDRTGPPAERYSYAGTNAANADLEALEVAKGMAEQNVSAETIRQATGWFQGADGKWRFEIDDSGMRYSARGDLNYGDPDYWRYRELRDKLERDMLGIGSEAVTEAERAEYEELAPRYRDFYLQPGVRGDGSATATRLSDYIQHDELFEQYPQLRDARLVFEDMEDGKQGSYNPDTNTITLSESLQNSERDDALAHEIQHAIQEAEGFARGASPQYWALREYESGDLVGERLRREHDNLFRSLSQEEQNQFTRYRELDRELNRTMFAELGTEEAADYERYEAEQDALYDELYGNEWFRKLLDLERRMDDIPGEYRAMYSNTSGEIEARDAEARRKLTADERRAAPPDLGNEDTIFAQSGAGVQASIDYDTDNRPYVTVEEDILDGVPEKDWARKVKAVLREKFPDGITVGNSEINIGGRTGRELTWSGTSRWMRANTPVAFADKYRAANNADELLLASTDYVNEGLDHPRRDDITDFSRGKVQFRIGDRDYTADVIVAALKDGRLEINSAPGGYSKNPADKVFNLEQLTPMNYLERMAGWNPDSAWYSMAKQLEAGERNERAYIVQANALLADWLEDNEEWVLRSDGQGKDAVWYEVEVPELLELGMGDKPVFGDSIKVWMTPSMKVHLYLESKNYDNLRHMVGGRTFPDKELYSEGKRQEAFAQGKTVRLAPETVKKLVSDLTPEERELAAMLERYYNQFAAERINKVSNALYGYDRAVTTNYAPIYTNSNYNQKEIGKFDQTAEGVGNLKQRIRGAKNPSYNLSAYDAFERHVDQTARFVGMAIPARNWKTLLNWRERDNSMSDVITHKWGSESLKYITDLLTDLQGGSPRKAQFQISSFADRLWSNYISAVFGANPSIVLKQLGSIPLGGAYLGMGNVPTPRQMANIDRDLIALYTSELDWRLMGYATPETKQLKDHPNWTQRNSFFRNVFGGGAITGMDGWAASTLWPWAENKVRRERPELEVGTEEQVNAGQSPFYRAVAAEFDNAVNRSQSMSDTLHNARIRKADNAILRTLTMFKSDAAQTYNAFRQTIGEAQYYKRTGASSKTQRTARAAMGAAFLAWIVNAAWTAGVNFLVNLAKTKGKNYRDDEDELTAESVLGKMATDMISGMSGVVILGEELAGALGSAVTGERWYGLDAPGIEQLNDTLESIINSSKSLKKLLTDAVNIGRQGGDVLAYLNSHRADIIGGIKDVAATAVTYFPGLPVNNVEAYLAGLISWALPSVGTAYEDLFETPEKADLSGLEGDALVTRVTDILGGRLDDVSEKAAEDIATLYAAGYSEALPAGVPTQITVTDKDTDTSETVELDAYQRQFFERVWTETVGRAVDDLVAMPEYEQASPDEQVKMLNQIYRFANETAKAETIEKYSPPSTIAEAAEDIADGRTLAEWAAYDVLSDDVSGTFGKLTDEGLGYEQALDVAETVNELGDDSTAVERYLAVAQMPIPEDEKELALRGIMTDSAYSKYETARAAGIDTLDYCEFLDRISDISGDGRQERVWALIDSMRLTNRQKDVLHLAAGYKDSTLSKTPWHN